MILNSDPCFMKTSPAVWDGLMPTPSSVIIALVCGSTLNSSAAYFRTAVNGADSGTDNLMGKRTVRHMGPGITQCTHTLKGRCGSEVNVILNVTFAAPEAALFQWKDG